MLPLLTTGFALGACHLGRGHPVPKLESRWAGFTQQLSILSGLGRGIDYSCHLTRTRTGYARLSTQAGCKSTPGPAGRRRRTLFAGNHRLTCALVACFIVGVRVLSGAAVAGLVSVFCSRWLAPTDAAAGAQTGVLGGGAC